MRERITQPTQVRSVEGTFPVVFVYTAGVAGEEFGRALRDQGKFLGSRCADCKVTYVPPRTYCERCFGRLAAKVEAGPAGELVSFTETPEGTGDATGAVWGLVRLDGADTVLVNRIAAKDPRKLRIGARVKAVFRPKKDRTGLVTDVESFVVE